MEAIEELIKTSYIMQQIVNGISLGSIYSLTAIGYTMVYGILKLVNFAHGDIMMVGAYTALFLLHGSTWPTAFGIVAAVVTGSFAGYLIERLVYRPLRYKQTDHAVYLASLAVSVLMQNIAMLTFTPQPRKFPVSEKLVTTRIGEIVSTSPLFYIMVGTTVATGVLLMVFTKRSKIGIAMRACSENISAANLMGIDVNYIISITFLIGAGFAGLSGFMLAAQYGRVDPLMGFLIGLKAFTACVLGGIGNIFGAFLGGYFLGLAEVLTVGLLPAKYSGFRDVFVFTLLIAVLLLRPEGILSSVQQGRD